MATQREVWTYFTAYREMVLQELGLMHHDAQAGDVVELAKRLRYMARLTETTREAVEFDEATSVGPKLPVDQPDLGGEG